MSFSLPVKFMSKVRNFDAIFVKRMTVLFTRTLYVVAPLALFDGEETITCLKVSMKISPVFLNFDTALKLI